MHVDVKACDRFAQAPQAVANLITSFIDERKHPQETSGEPTKQSKGEYVHISPVGEMYGRRERTFESARLRVHLLTNSGNASMVALPVPYRRVGIHAVGPGRTRQCFDYWLSYQRAEFHAGWESHTQRTNQDELGKSSGIRRLSLGVHKYS